jgi:hypothetical protein
MAPKKAATKAKAKAAPTRTERFTTVMADLKKAKEEAKKQIVNLRRQVRSEKQRHKRIIKKASMLDAAALMEIAGLRHMTIEDLARHAIAMGVAEKRAAAPEDADTEDEPMLGTSAPSRPPDARDVDREAGEEGERPREPDDHDA